MASVVQEKLGYAELEAKKRKERLLQLKRKAQGELDVDEEKQVSDKEDDQKFSTEDSDQNNDSAVNLETDELDLSKLAPRKVDWDLKRGITKSLDILQERTNGVITEIVQERMENIETD